MVSKKKKITTRKKKQSSLKQNKYNRSDTYQEFVSQNRNPPEEKVKSNHKKE